jgi:hypothetical protein
MMRQSFCALKRRWVAPGQVSRNNAAKEAKNMKEIPPHQGRHPAARFDFETKTRMGQQLRVMYGEVMNQGVPDCHREILKRLDARAGTARDG